MTPQDTTDGKFVFYDDESFNGGIARFLANVGLERMYDLTKVAGITHGQRPTASAASESALEALAAEIDVDAIELLKRSLPAAPLHGHTYFYGLVLPTNLIEKHTRRVAPSALKSACYHRALWDLRLFPFCIQTGEPLISSCLNLDCSAGSLGWSGTMGIDMCEGCMRDLKDIETTTVSPALLCNLRSIAELFIPSRRHRALERLPVELRSQNGQVAVELLVRLLTVVDPALKKHRLGLHRADPAELAEAVAGAWSMMRTWPDSFERLALQRLNDRRKFRDGDNAGQALRLIKGQNTNSFSGELKGIACNLRNSFDINGPNAKNIEKRRMMIHPAAKMIGVNTGPLTKLRRAGFLKSVLVMDRSSSLQPMFDRQEIEELMMQIQGRLGVNSAAWKLGISHDGVRELVVANLVQSLTHPFFLARYGIPQLEAASFNHFIANISSCASRFVNEEMVSLSVAIKVIGGRPKPWGAVFQSLLNGGLPFQLNAGTSPMVRRISIRHRDVFTLTKFRPIAGPTPNLPTPAFISRADAIEILNTSPKVGTALCKQFTAGTHQNEKSVSLHETLLLSKRMITSAELALRRMVNNKRAGCDAVSDGIAAVAPGCFSREHAEAFYPI